MVRAADSFPVYRRIATMMLVPGQLKRSVEMVTVDPPALAEALERETSAEKGDARAKGAMIWALQFDSLRLLKAQRPAT